MRPFHWKLDQAGEKFTDGKGTIREVTTSQNPRGQLRSKQRVDWKRLAGKGPESGSMPWSSWCRWVKDEWLEPRPERLPVPEVTLAERAFPTGTHTPPWRWVPNEFKDREDGEFDNQHNPWCKLVSQLFLHVRELADWRALPKEGVDPDKALDAVWESLGNYGIKHQKKIASVAYMLSEWFEDFWFDGDTHTTIGNHDLSTLLEKR